MRGTENNQENFFSYISQEQRIPENHPMRMVRVMVDRVLAELSPRFDALYAELGRPSIPPEQLLRALVVQVLYTIRSERLLMEQLDYNLLFRWFVGLSMDDPIWDHSVFSKNRDRLLEGDIAHLFFQSVLAQAREHQLLSNEHFTVDGTLIEAWAGQKSFRKKNDTSATTAGSNDDDSGSNPTVNFRGEKRTNQTHQSTTDPEARMMRKSNGTESKLSFSGHVTIENRHGLVIETGYTFADGKAERQEAIKMLCRIRKKNGTKRSRRRRITVGADAGYDTQDFIDCMRTLIITPHVSQYPTTDRRSSAIDERTTHHAGYQVSQKKRKRIEEVFGWLKTVGLMRKIRFKGRLRGGWIFMFTAACYNLVRMKNLLSVPLAMP